MYLEETVKFDQLSLDQAGEIDSLVKWEAYICNTFLYIFVELFYWKSDKST